MSCDNILDQPVEISADEFHALMEQIQTDFTKEECQGELLDAARYNDIDVVRALLKCHPGICDFQDSNTGNTALHMASANGHEAVVQLLLSVGANATITNHAGNTPLHWASANGQDTVVQVLLNNSVQDVLQRNQFGRSALTEGFTSQHTELVKHLLEHESASEERLVQSTGGAAVDGADGIAPDSVTHTLLLGRSQPCPVTLHVRELAIAKTDDDTILGQAIPDADTTGLGIWAASIVCAQWLISLDPVLLEGKVVLELGAGCGVPGLAIATNTKPRKIYVTDFNTRVIDNLRYNIHLNALEDICEARFMNWKDQDTWPTEKVEVLIGSDLIYETEMAVLLVQAIEGLLSDQGYFYYVAPNSGRQGQVDLFHLMERSFVLTSKRSTPPEFIENPLESLDDTDYFLHFNELKCPVGEYALYCFQRNRH